MSLSKRDRFRILERDQFTCQYCGRQAPHVELHVDHVLARANGGSDDPDNLVASCVECNAGKAAGLLSCFVEPIPKEFRRAPYTMPFRDTCPECSAGPTDALREETRGVGYVAFYRCPNGHEWDCYWDSSIRMTQSDMLDRPEVTQ